MKEAGGVRIVIADDHTLVRDGLKRILHEDADLHVVGEAATGEQAVAMVKSLEPDVLLLDLAMPDGDGLSVLRKLESARVAVRTILLTAAIEKPQLAAALQLGARGLIMKTCAIDVLVKSIHCVMDGEYWVDRASLAEVAHQARTLNGPDLTARELEIVSEIVSGGSNREIAEKFSISEKTVKRHLANIFEKLGVSSRLELAVMAMNQGLIPKARV